VQQNALPSRRCQRPGCLMHDDHGWDAALLYA
jgi:hypothetical protein